ncbi:hypothetical protein [Pseudomonas sp.]|uniref:hypothetical protein n=1 Tax=Pseudomonas sp. TaxID=306 RepID=UPI003A978488
MIKMNEKMRMDLKEVDRGGRQLPSSLSVFVARGITERAGCFFLAALVDKKTNAVEADFLDRTGWECFVNSIHVDDFATSDYLLNACLFVQSIFRAWKRRGYPGTFQAIISNDEYGSVVKFHLLRNGESWVGSDLEDYEDSILLVDSCEDDEFMDSLFC